MRSVARTTAEHSAYTSISVTLTGLGDDALADGYDIAGTGVVDLVNGDADLDVTIPDSSASAAAWSNASSGASSTSCPRPPSEPPGFPPA